VFHDQPQSTTAQLMGRETASLSATPAKLSITGTIGTPPTHGLVVLFDFAYSCMAQQFDIDGKNFLEGGARICCQRPRSSIFMRAPSPGT
jgi:hypothetical protein